MITSQTQEVRFGFGKNWARYSRTVGEPELARAIQGLQKLLPEGIDPATSSFLDIGSGSGLHSVAAARLGFPHIVATDYDSSSVATTKAVAARFGIADRIDAFQDDILHSRIEGSFDVVYSWGVLHHTGHMWRAIEVAKSLVTPGGALILALYVKTPSCGMWTRIKRSYSASPRAIQVPMLSAYYSLLTAARLVRGSLWKPYDTRGMDRFHDAVDWLGGYPYESASHDEVISAVTGDENFRLSLSFPVRPTRGWLGTGCGEYVFRRTR